MAAEMKKRGTISLWAPHPTFHTDIDPFGCAELRPSDHAEVNPRPFILSAVKSQAGESKGLTLSFD